MSKVLDLIYTYKFINIITDTWTEQPAFELGIIDENGKQIKRSKSLITIEEKKALTALHKLAFAVKRIIGKLPFSQSKLLAYATAVKIIRESAIEDVDSIETCFIEHFMKDIDMDVLNEEITNSTGASVALTDTPLGKVKRRKDDNIFDVDCDTFTKCRWGKKRYAKWTDYMDMESDLGKSIQKFSYKNPKKALMLRHPSTKAIIYLKFENR